MGRTAKDNRDLPHPRPVRRIELSGEHMGLRLAAAALFLLVGIGALAYGFTRLMTPETGWQAIEANTAEGASCCGDLVFLYELGAGGGSPTAENRAISALYTDVCRKLFQLFHTTESFEGMTNLRDVSLHPNETLTVDGVLYRAFETVQRYGDRTIYLGPVYARYGGLFHCDDVQLADFDPYLSDEVREEYGAYAAFARDPQAIDLRLLGDNQVCLYVSEEYLAFARREEIADLLDFGWLQNAFIVDEIARVMMDNGYTHGSISSYDGFSRNLDDRGLSYDQNVFDLADGSVYPAGVMTYKGPMGIIYLRDYPMNSRDSQWYRRLENGEVRANYLDPADGLCKSAVHDLICYSETAGCAEIALRAAPIYVAESLDHRALKSLAGAEIYSIYCEGRVIFGNDPELALTRLYEAGDIRYTVAKS